MIDQLLDVLKIGFLVLLYLFFLRVLWVVLTEVRTARSGAATGVVPPGAHAAQATQLAPDRLVPEPPLAVPAAVPEPPPARAKRRRKGAVSTLTVLEPRSLRGSTFRVAGEITLGRSPGCTVTIGEDEFISNLHARVFVADGQTLVEDLGSTNGTYVNGDRLGGARPLRRGDRVQLGRTVLEAR